MPAARGSRYLAKRRGGTFDGTAADPLQKVIRRGAGRSSVWLLRPTGIPSPPARPDEIRRGGRKRLTGAGADIDRLLAIEEPTLGVAVCVCGKRFTPLSERDTRCSSTCSGSLAPATRTVVIGGIEYTATSVGSSPVTGDYATGSPLLGLHRVQT